MEQPRQHVEHVLAGDRARGQHQFDGDQHRFEPVHRHRRQHLRHHPIALGLTQQRLLQLPQGPGHVPERSAVAQCAGFTLNDRDVVLPVVMGLVACEAATMTRHFVIADHDHQHEQLHPQAGQCVRALAGHAVAVALE